MTDSEVDQYVERSLVPSLKKRLRSAVCDLIECGKVTSLAPILRQDECLAQNLIMRFLMANGYHNTASIFHAETDMMPMQVGDLTIENLLRPASKPSVSIQTEGEDIESRLAAIDAALRRRRAQARAARWEDELEVGLRRMDAEFDAEFTTLVNAEMDVFAATELAELREQLVEAHKAELERLRRETELEFKTREADMTLQFEQSCRPLRETRRQLESELAVWATKRTERTQDAAVMAEIETARREYEDKSAQIAARAGVLQAKVEKIRRKVEDVQLERKRVRNEMQKLEVALGLMQRL